MAPNRSIHVPSTRQLRLRRIATVRVTPVATTVTASASRRLVMRQASRSAQTATATAPTTTTSISPALPPCQPHRKLVEDRLHEDDRPGDTEELNEEGGQHPDR